MLYRLRHPDADLAVYFHATSRYRAAGRVFILKSPFHELWKRRRDGIPLQVSTVPTATWGRKGRYPARRLSRSGTGSRTPNRTSSRMRTGSTWRASARSCADPASAKSGHRWHAGSPSGRPPTSSPLKPERRGCTGGVTCNLPSKVLWIVTHLLGCAPLVVIAVISESSSSLFSLSFLTSDSMARLAKPSLSPPCLWHMRLCTMLRQASAEVGAFVASPDISPALENWEASHCCAACGDSASELRWRSLQKRIIIRAERR